MSSYSSYRVCLSFFTFQMDTKGHSDENVVRFKHHHPASLLHTRFLFFFFNFSFCYYNRFTKSLPFLLPHQRSMAPPTSYLKHRSGNDLTALKAFLNPRAPLRTGVKATACSKDPFILNPTCLLQQPQPCPSITIVSLLHNKIVPRYTSAHLLSLQVSSLPFLAS